MTRDTALRIGKQRTAAWLFLGCALVYSLTNYGGTRSPDAEAVFRVGQSLVEGRGFAVEQLAEYPGFGVAPGQDGKLYSIYPPLQSLALAPLIALGSALNNTGWYDGLDLPASHYVDRGLETELFGRPVDHPEPHALRFTVSFFNALITALGVALFFRIASRLLGSRASALATTLLFAFGTLAWHYSGTMFTEPLATLLVLYCFHKLVARDSRFGDVPPTSGLPGLALSGLSLGLAVATHVTALLFFPFFVYYAWSARGGWPARRPAAAGSLAWLCGAAVPFALLAWYNAFRFGSPFEDGRALSAINVVTLTHPGSESFWQAFYGLLLGAGKGLLVFCPAVLVAVVGWPVFARAHGRLAAILGGAVLVRLLFAAAYGDWHGGFCLGPRYLLMVVPFLVLPFGFWWRGQLRRERWGRIAIAAVVCWLLMVQQFYFALGEIFRYLYEAKLRFLREGVDVFADQRIYLDWALSPALHLLEHPRGAFLLGSIPLSNHAVWAAGSGLLLALVAGGCFLMKRGTIGDRP